MSDSPQQTHYRICPLCEACCGLEIKVSEGRVISIRGHEADVLSRGYICPKGVALKDLHEDPDRLRQPLIKRDGVFHEATWEEAFAEIERRLQPLQAAHGRHSVAMVAGNPTSHKLGLMLYYPRLLKALGTRQIFSAATLDQMPRHVVSGLLYGHWMTVPVPDIAHCDWLLVLGANPVASNGSMWTVPDFRGQAKALQARGGKLLVIDPRQTETAQLADEHHFIRPGGDVFLLLGMLHSLFAQNLVKLGAAAPWVDGLEAVREAVSPYSPEQVSARCAVPAETIERLARELAQTPRAAIYGRIGTCTQSFGTLNTWLIDLLNLLSGHMDQVGGTMFPKAAAFAANTLGPAGQGRGVVLGRHHSRVSQAPEVMGELPITCLAEEIETPGADQVRALITLATNPVLSSPNGARLAKAFEGLEFMLSLDIYLNETSCHADVILPGPSPLEDLHYDVPYPQMSWRNHARYSAPVFERAPGQPEEWQTLLRLAAIAQGAQGPQDTQALDEQLFQTDLRRLPPPQSEAVAQATAGLQGPQRLLAQALCQGPYPLSLAEVQQAPGGLDLGPLTPRLPEVLRTTTGRIDLAPAGLLADLQRVPAALQESSEALLLIGRREVRSNNSWMHNLPTLAKGPMRCTLLVHPEDASTLQLQHGAWAWLALKTPPTDAQATAPGLRVQVELSPRMMRGVVSLPHGWGHDLAGARQQVAAQRPGVNLNALMSDQARDPLSGNAVLSGVSVHLQALTEPA
ncbi:molybdopterin-dependent oxidoreductase [Curvibacter sp. HBC28]|uniref:Molybdopterin-dependent oxidoreductase n=1 Tax=Curvibacter microcysteis TaxID=3026419 RepID=A0ABT5MPJ3_9BURK|nr:molybdopterin-dependent oxidoreductase [Curvibacter sp. HBC28]MDD0817156.1 molybdopterin-dependent oxidoreductase [Curvibacter sp. HBC28]